MDGSTWNALGVVTEIQNNFANHGVQTVDLTTFTAINDQAAVTIRITLDGTTSGAGNNRFDNFKIQGTAIASPTDIEKGFGLPEDFRLSQNYPNPFNPTTRIEFEMPVSGIVTLAVYDLLGRQVALLANENYSAGTHNIAFDASELASGVYMYRLNVAGQTFTRKMTLVK